MPYSPRAHYSHTKLEPKGHFARGSFRTISVGRHGKKLVVGCPKGRWNKRSRRCRSGMRRVTLMTPRRRAANRSKWTVANAPRRVRLKWLRQAQKAKRYYARCRRKYGVELHRAAGGGHLSFARPGPVIPPPVLPPSTSAWPPGQQQTFVSREQEENPELLMYTNPQREYFSGGVGTMRLKRRSARRCRRGRNLPVTARVGSRKHTWRSLVKRLGVKKAARAWRSGKRFHGYTKTRCMNRRRCRNRRGGARSYRALVRRHGVKIAARMWRKRGRR